MALHRAEYAFCCKDRECYDTKRVTNLRDALVGLRAGLVISGTVSSSPRASSRQECSFSASRQSRLPSQFGHNCTKEQQSTQLSQSSGAKSHPHFVPIPFCPFCELA
jgi:hypothetical protein